MNPLASSHGNQLLPGRKGWDKHIAGLDEEVRQAVLEQILLVSLLSTQRLSQLFVTHGASKMPYKLHPLRMLWKCPKLMRY